MTARPVRYRSADEDSDRWTGFAFRRGDIVISTRSRCGTTWVQNICALLIHQRPELPAPLPLLSPWLDWLAEPRDAVIRRLERQDHRRVIKTHTPLDGVPLDQRATYIVVGRHPLDMAVSLYNQSANLRKNVLPRPPLREWLRSWITDDADPRQTLDSLPGVLAHAADAWSRRGSANVILVHYADLCADLEGEMRALASKLAVSVPEDLWPELIDAARFSSMCVRADHFAPVGVLRDTSQFFRRGTSGAGCEALEADELHLYAERVSRCASPSMLDWLHHGRRSTEREHEGRG